MRKHATSRYGSVAARLAVLSLTAALLVPAGALADDADPPDGFPDIDGNAHEEAILAIVAEGITEGRADGTFGPDEDVTRGQMATFLERALELPAWDPSDDEVPLTDVVGTTHEAGILAVAQAGITTGFADGTFRPNDEVTRGQMAAFLARALDLDDDAPPFPDAVDSTHAGPIGAVAQAGIAGGFDDGNFGPTVPVTRGQMATFIARALELVDRIDPPDPLPEPPSMSDCDDAATSQEHTARCLYAAVDAGELERAREVADDDVVDDLVEISSSPTWDTWQFNGCDQAILLVTQSDTSCTFYEPAQDDWPHGLVFEFGMGTRDGAPFVEQLGTVG